MSREERLTKDEVFTLLKKLSEPVGPSGYEGEVRGIVVDFLKNVADSVWIDTLGNVIAAKKASSSDGKMMFAAHMDEIGLFVSHIDEKGYLRVLQPKASPL